MKLKRGIIRKDGMVFWEYSIGYKNKDRWVTSDKFLELKKDQVLRLKKWRTKNPQKHNNNSKKWQKANPKKCRENTDKWCKANLEKVKETRNNYFCYKMKTDPLFKLRHSIRVLIRDSIKRNGYTKKSRSNEIIGCSWELFKKHIESLLKPKMTWKNHGTWHFDHIIPLSSAKTEQEIIKLNHYTNFQPLWAEENLSKGSRLPFGMIKK